MGAKSNHYYSCTPALDLVMRVSSILMPVCGRVTLLPHPPEPVCHSLALCSAIRPSRQVASIHPRLADLISIINIIIEIVSTTCCQFLYG